MNSYLKRILAVCVVLLASVVQAQSIPNCSSSASDPDKDGWGWENNRSCKVLATTAYPACASATSDPDGDGWGWENNRSCKLGAGTTYPACASASSDPDGDGWGWENNKTCKVGSTGSTAAGFKVSGSSLQDANGNNFYPRGVNNPHAWYDTQSYAVLPNLAARRTNLVRIVWTTQGSAARLDEVLTAVETQKMISMVELHDGTGSNDPALLEKLASYWARSDVAAVLKKHERYLMINIANEWGAHDKSEAQWAADYKRPISIIRNAGLTTTIVIDNPGWGQNGNGALWHGQELLNHDPRHNLMFSIHMYGAWNNASDIYNAMNNYRNNKLALVIGEFGYNHNSGNNNLGSKVDAGLLMRYAQEFGVGYIAWSTQGNDTENAWLDLMTNWSGTTAWGNMVWYSQYGIYNTAQPASVFK